MFEALQSLDTFDIVGIIATYYAASQWVELLYVLIPMLVSAVWRSDSSERDMQAVYEATGLPIALLQEVRELYVELIVLGISLVFLGYTIVSPDWNIGMFEQQGAALQSPPTWVVGALSRGQF